jgi:hypothetical protein
MVLQQGLQTGALKQSAWQNAISGTIYPALERARGKHTTRTHAPTTTHSFRAPTFRASVGGEHGLTR